MEDGPGEEAERRIEPLDGVAFVAVFVGADEERDVGLRVPPRRRRLVAERRLKRQLRRHGAGVHLRTQKETAVVNSSRWIKIDRALSPGRRAVR